MTYVHKTERVGDLIVQVVADEDGSASNPRDNDNFTEIFGSHRRYTIGDGEPPREHMAILERGGIKLLARYMRRFGDPRDGSKVLAITKLGMLDHSGVSYYTVPLGSSANHWTDSAGWDSGAVGYVIVTQKRWDEMGGGDPFEPVDSTVDFPLGSIPMKVQRVWHILDAEVKEYDDWSRGNVWGYVVTKPCPHHHFDELDVSETLDLDRVASCQHSETVDSCWGFIGDPDEVWTEALAAAKAN